MGFADEDMTEACKESKQCAPAKHHFDECVERVQAAQDTEEGTKEDCVEECTFPNPTHPPGAPPSRSPGSGSRFVGP